MATMALESVDERADSELSVPSRDSPGLLHSPCAHDAHEDGPDVLRGWLGGGMEISFELSEGEGEEGEGAEQSSSAASAHTRDSCGPEELDGGDGLEGAMDVADICILPPSLSLSSLLSPQQSPPSTPHGPPTSTFTIDPAHVPLPPTPTSSTSSEFVCLTPRSIRAQSSFKHGSSSTDHFVPLVFVPREEQEQWQADLRRRSAPAPRKAISMSTTTHTRRASELDLSRFRQSLVQSFSSTSMASASPTDEMQTTSDASLSASDHHTRRARDLSWPGLKRTLSLGSNASARSTHQPGINTSSPTPSMTGVVSSVSGADATISSSFSRASHRRSLSLSQRVSGLGRKHVGAGVEGVNFHEESGRVGEQGVDIDRTPSGRTRRLRITVPRPSTFRNGRSLQRHRPRTDFEGPSDCTDQDIDIAQLGSSSGGPSTSTSMMSTDRGPVPSGPSSPSSPLPTAPLSSGLRGSQLDDHLRNFPRPPGRIVSVTGFSDMQLDRHDLWSTLSSLGQQTGAEGAQASALDALFGDLPVVEHGDGGVDGVDDGKVFIQAATDCSPTLPAFDLASEHLSAIPLLVGKPINTSSAHNDTRLPPSPALTPSPNLSLSDSLVLGTPESPPLNAKDRLYRTSSGLKSHPLLSRLGPLTGETEIGPDDEDGHHSTESTITTSSPTSQTSSSCTITTIGDLLHTYSTAPLPRVDRQQRQQPDKEETMSANWDRDSVVDPSPPLAHPYHHAQHKSTPSVPHSTRTSYTPSASTHDPSNYSSPPTSYSALSRRQSKFTAFSGSSASSTYSSSDSSSLRHGTPHIGLSEHPDISTVFEEDGDDDFSRLSIVPARKSPSKLERLTGEHQQGLAQRDREASSVDRKDVGPRGDDGENDRPSQRHQQHSLSTSTSHSNLQQHATGSLRLKAQPSHSTLPRTGRRTERSGTITSQLSAHSTQSTRSQHPFAAMARPSSPPMRPQRSEGNAGMSSSQSMPNIMNAYSASGAGPSAPPPEVLIAEPEDVDEDVCPVCNVSMSSEYRVRGEKPLVVSECGHEVHYDCFVLCYGATPSPYYKQSYGMCGICRQPMKVIEGGGRRKGKKSNKLAMLTGETGDDDPSDMYAHPSSASISSSRRQTPTGIANDPIDATAHGNGGVQPKNSSMTIAEANNGRTSVCVPIISVRNEFASISKVRQPNKGSFMTAMISVIVPPAGDRGIYKATPRNFGLSALSPPLPQLPPSPLSDEFGHSQVRDSLTKEKERVAEDLRKRMIDYDSSGLDTIGQLEQWDVLAVRKGSMMRDFNVYLYQEALICVTQEKKSGLMSSMSRWKTSKSESSGSSSKTIVPDSRILSPPSLKLKGRIYLRHVRQIADTTDANDLSLTIIMIDPKLDSFILVFKDPKQHAKWRNALNDIVHGKTGGLKGAGPDQQPRSAKLAKIFGQNYDTSNEESKSATGSNWVNTPSTSGGFSNQLSPPVGSIHSTLGDAAYVKPLGSMHAPVDLVVVMSLASNTTGTKLKVMRQSLGFILATLGPRDRVSFVSAQPSTPPIVRKTPLLNPTKVASRERLESFIDGMGAGRIEDDEFEVELGPEDRGDIVNGMNSALDVVLSRGNQRNPLGAIFAISENPENIKRAQMDLVTARLDTANVPVHTVGFGRDHDPSPLWMISNHTHGTYTFTGVESNDLKRAVGGLLGGLLSVAMTNMRVNLETGHYGYKILRIAGASNSVVQQDGKGVEIELRELRFGETREVLVEMDMIDQPLNVPTPHSRNSASSGSGSSDPESLPDSIGHQRLSTDPTRFADAMMRKTSITDEQVFDLNCSYHDPAIGRSVLRLIEPITLTTAISPPDGGAKETHPDPGVVRRRMEILTSEMITRALLIASRKNYTQAATVLEQTRTIIRSMKARVTDERAPRGESRLNAAQKAVGVFDALDEDLETVIWGLKGEPTFFERDQRNFAAQQAVVLRSQRAWTVKSACERVFIAEGAVRMLDCYKEWAASSMARY